jgi:hypothetical protein
MKRRELPDGPWRDLALDFTSASLYNKELLVIVDYYSRYVDIRLQSGLTAKETTRSLRQTFATLGFPRSVTCDNGQPFSSEEFKEFCETFDIKIFHTPPFWPQANGLVEKQNTGIKKRLQISKANASKDWESDLLFDYLVMYRSTPHDTTGRSPFELMFGRKMKDKIPTILEPVDGDLDAEVRERDTRKKEAGKTAADKRRRATETDIQPGDEVLLRNNQKANKLSTNFGPVKYTVTEIRGSDCKIVSKDEGVERRRNITALKKLYPEATPPAPQANANNSSSHSQAPPDTAPAKRQRRPPKHLDDYVPRAIVEEKEEM